MLGTLEGSDPGEVTICDILEVNKTIQRTTSDITKAEMILEFKLEDAIELDGNRSNASRASVRGQKAWA